jgi:hypothetical protein
MTAAEPDWTDFKSVCEASLVTGRWATKLQMAARRVALYALTEHLQRATVRQVFYQATVHSIVDETEAGYDNVQRCLVELRLDYDMLQLCRFGAGWRTMHPHLAIELSRVFATSPLSPRLAPTVAMALGRSRSPIWREQEPAGEDLSGGFQVPSPLDAELRERLDNHRSVRSPQDSSGHRRPRLPVAGGFESRDLVVPRHRDLGVSLWQAH